uniref:JAZF zinc finger 1 n=1 Tax=Equus asinus TaxID=9793 RepID=A0A9L0J8J2_EQUAS
MTGIAAASFFSNTCRFGGCGLHFPTLADLIEHIEDNHIDTDPRVLEKQELQQPTYVALSYINRWLPITLGIKVKLLTMANRPSVIRHPPTSPGSPLPTPSHLPQQEPQLLEYTLFSALILAGPSAGIVSLPSELHTVHFLTSFRRLVRCYLH